MIRLKDTLSHLTYTQACKLLGANGPRLIRAGGTYDIDLTEQVTLTKDLFQLHLDGAVVTIEPDPSRPDHLAYACDSCETAGADISAGYGRDPGRKPARHPLGKAGPVPGRP
ncbi:MAG: hypothetical protein K9N21_01960 [Deltaproteobacteria bacterium]|nr:hypothetical protein [Deltaproteobacteria bacterium]